MSTRRASSEQSGRPPSFSVINTKTDKDSARISSVEGSSCEALKTTATPFGSASKTHPSSGFSRPAKKLKTGKESIRLPLGLEGGKGGAVAAGVEEAEKTGSSLVSAGLSALGGVA